MTKSTAPNQSLRLRLICLAPPPDHDQDTPTEFGLQDKQQGVHAGVFRSDGSLCYEFEIQHKPNPNTNQPRFLGPYVHGTPTEQFLYLSYRRIALGPSSWLWRIKTPLNSITWEQIGTVQPGGWLEGTIDGGSGGKVALHGDGWSVRDPV